MTAPDFAQRLGSLLDVPLITCERASNGSEFHYPTGERDTLSSAGNRAQLARWRPGLALMAAMGGNVAAVDVDTRNGADLDKTRQMLDGLGVRVYGEIETPSGGRHFYVTGHPELASAHNLNGWPGIDVQSFGSLLFLPGTQRPKYSGAGYRIIFEDLEALADGGDPDGAAALAGWVAEHRSGNAGFEPSPPWRGEVSPHQSAYLQKMLDGMHHELSEMGKDSGRNNAVYVAALKVGNYIAGAGLDEARAVAALLDASEHNGLVKEDGRAAVMASIQSGIRNGKAHPRAVPDSSGDGPPRAYSGHRRESEPEPEPAYDGVGKHRAEGMHNLDLEPITQTDDGNALRLVLGYGDRLRRVADMRKWFEWDGQRWAIDHDGRAVREAARELARSLPDGSADEKKFRRMSMSAIGISSCTRVAESDPRISILADTLDAHPELINTPSGVVNLRTGEIAAHDATLLLTRITAYPVELGAPHPMWDKFLAETFQKNDGAPDLEMVGYLQRLAGLALLGKVHDQVLPFLHGVGANGKGVVALVLQGFLGDADSGGYAVSAPDGFLMSGREHVHPTEVARLRGARLVVCSEQSSGKTFDEAKVKKLTGGDRLTGRFMRGDFFDFTPSHLVVVLSNHLPAVKEGGPAFWRRMRKIPFLHVVPDAQQVKDLDQVLLAAEGPAILGWAVAGAVEVLANGLQDPAAVIAATKEYEISEDTLASFVQEECLTGPHWHCTVPDFLERYEEHCKGMGAEPLSARGLTMRLVSEYQVSRDRTARTRLYRGITLQGTVTDDA